MKRRKKCEHVAPPRTREGKCALCKREREKAYYHTVYKSKKITLVMAYNKRTGYQNSPKMRQWHRAYAKADKIRNPDRYKAYSKKWMETHREYRNALERARRNRVLEHLGVRQSEWDAIVRRQRGKCADCGSSGPLTQDHIVPISRGGAHAPYNLRAVCGLCNSKKGNALLSGAQLSLVLRKGAAA